MMARSLVCMGTLLALSAMAASGQVDFVPAEPLHEAGLAKYWQLQLPLEPGQFVRDAFLVDDQIYVGTQDGYAYSVDALTGVILWLQPVTRSGYRFFEPTHMRDWTVFVTPIDLQIYERLTGDPVTRKRLRFPPGTGAVSDGRRFFIGGLDRRIWTFDVRTQYVDWRLMTDGPIVSRPMINGPFLLSANDGGTIYSLTRDDKRYHWRARTYGPIAADLVKDEFGIYVASQDQSLYLLNELDGSQRWRTRFGSPLREAPYLTREVAYQFSDEEGVVAVATADQLAPNESRQRWHVPEGRKVLTVGESTVFMWSRTGSILAVRVADGVVEHEVPAPGFSMPLPTRGLTMVLLAAKDGRLFCARPKGVPPLKREDVLNALRVASRPQEAEEVAPAPTTQPASVVPDFLQSKDKGPPLGGRSKVSREFGREGGSE
jgi:outer membrane protein assembly factor BamB